MIPFARINAHDSAGQPSVTPPVSPPRSERIEHRETILQRPPEIRFRTENKFIEKPLVAEGEAYREAIRREADVAPDQVVGYLERVEHTAATLLGRAPSGGKSAWKQD